MCHSCLQLGEHCSELKDIHLGQCYSITDEGMVALARGCPKLQRLYLQENKLVSPTHLVSFVLFLSACLTVSARTGAQVSSVSLFGNVECAFISYRLSTGTCLCSVLLLLLLIFWGYKDIVRAVSLACLTVGFRDVGV